MIGYKIISLEERTLQVYRLFIDGDVIIPNEVIYNNIEFKVVDILGHYGPSGTGDDRGSNVCNTITFNKYINMNNNQQLHALKTTYFYVNEENPYMTALNGALYNKNITKLLSYKNNNDYIMPNSVIELQEYSFHDMILNGGIYGCKKIIFNDNIEEIKENSIYMIRSLEYLKLSNKIKILPPRILYGLDNLKTLILPSELEQIQTIQTSYNQNWTTSLENITIYNSNIINYTYYWLVPGPEATTMWDDSHEYVFKYLSNLKEIHIVDENPVALEDGIFTEGKYFTLKIYVPQGCKTIYENTTGWSNFYNIYEE